MTRALIIGATGQDGAWLTRLLAAKGYDLHGTTRDADMARTDGLEALKLREAISLHSMAPHDFRSVLQTIEKVQPDEIYNLSGQSSVALSFEQPAETMESIVSATLNMLEALRVVGGAIRFYNAGSSECFGDTGRHPANEVTAFRPRSPYGVAKAAAVSLVTNYREAYGLYACSGLLFNHESPLRPARFVTRKIVQGAVRIANGSGERLKLGDLSIHRDWGWAPDYVEMMWAMLQQPRADDYVVASGMAHALEEFVAAAFAAVGLDWRDHVDHDPKLKRPSDIAYSVGDPSKAARVIGWRPNVDFSGVVMRMIKAERDGLEAVL